MPEGPEVKIASNFYNDFFKNKEVKFEIITDYYSKKYDEVFKFINNNLSNFSPTYTVGKNIFLNINENSIFNFHLGMTGGWSTILIKHCHFRVFSKSKELFFKDVRKFSKMRIISKKYFDENHNKKIDVLNELYKKEEHLNLLNKKINGNRQICKILLDQKLFPGVGNYIKSEVLYKSKIHPEESWKNINTMQRHMLLEITKKIMKKSFKYGGAELKDFKNPFHVSKFKLEVYGKKRTEKNIKVSSLMTSDKRKSWFCPSIQKLADN